MKKAAGQGRRNYRAKHADKMPLHLVEPSSMLDPKALTLLSTLLNGTACKIHPMDFTTLLVLRDRGYATVTLVDGSIFAERTRAGKIVLERLKR